MNGVNVRTVQTTDYETKGEAWTLSARRSSESTDGVLLAMNAPASDARGATQGGYLLRSDWIALSRLCDAVLQEWQQEWQ